MITAERLRRCTGATGVLDLLRDLGYPVEPVDVDRAEWKRGGVAIPWNGTTTFQLIARLPNVDLFLLDGSVASESITGFLRAYAQYNVLTKSVLVNTADSTCAF